MYQIQNHFPFDVIPSDNGKVFLSIELEQHNLKSFVTMLESLSSFFRLVNGKARASLAISCNHANQEKNQKYYNEYSTCVVDTFKEFNHTSDYSPRELISVVNHHIKEIYPNSCYDSVKAILTKSGVLKTSGYYKKSL